MKKVLLALSFCIPLALLIYGFRISEGCPPSGKMSGCYGPIGSYWTLYEAQLSFQMPALIYGLIAASCVGLWGVTSKWSRLAIISGLLGSIFWIFLITIIFNPVIIQY